MPFYATETLIAQKAGRIIMVIVQIQAQEMYATPKITISVKKVPHVFPGVRNPLFLCFPKHFSSVYEINNCGYWH